MEHKAIDPLREAVDILGLQNTAKICKVSWQAVAKWLKNGLPRTEWTGETSYSKAIQKATKGKVKRKAILDYHAQRKAA